MASMDFPDTALGSNRHESASAQLARPRRGRRGM